MRAVTGRLGRLVLAAAWLFGAPAPRAWAMCNSIPVAQPWFPSERGSIGTPIGGPAQTVRIQLNPACPGENGKFDASSTALVTFVSAGGTVDRPAVAQFVDDTHLDVVIPTTAAAAGLPNGLAGPARITVTAGSGAELARIFELYEPTSGCDRKSRAVFDKFTVLPKPNDVTAGTDLLATLDGDANLLIPLDHTNVLPVSPTEAVAAFET